MHRYDRQIRLPEIGRDRQTQLENSSACIVGCGGLGIPVATYLAGAGVGRIRLIDADLVEESNLHRQVIYTEKNIGWPKVHCLENHLISLNANVQVESIEKRLDRRNAQELLKGFDLIFDCTDNLKSRFAINDACVVMDLPFVSGSIYKYEGQVGLFNFKKSATYRCLYNHEDDIEADSCNDAGVLGPSVGIIASMMTNEGIKVLLDLDDKVINKILFINTLNYFISIFEVTRNQEVIDKIIRRSTENLNDKELNSDEPNLMDIIQSVLKGNGVLLDVREAGEWPLLDSAFIQIAPLSVFHNEINSLDKNKTYYCFCQSGMRSGKTTHILRNDGFRSYNIGGIREVSQLMAELEKKNIEHE